MKNKQVAALLAGTVLASALLTGCDSSESTLGTLLDYVGSDDNTYLLYGAVQPADDNNIQLNSSADTDEAETGDTANSTIDENSNTDNGV